MGIPGKTTLSRHRVACGLIGALALAACNADAQQSPTSDDHAFRVVTVAEGLVNPWSVAFLPGGDYLVTERPGRLRLVRGGELQPEPIGGVPEVRASGQGGLLDVAIHPNFEQNRFVYLSFSKPGPEGATTAVVRGRFDGTRLADVEEIFEARAWRTAGQHFGSRLVFDDGYLFISVGERGAMQDAQNPSNHQGTIVRIFDDGRVPDDNPFVGVPDHLPEIWAYGVRNPQGLTLHPETGELWETEHGPRGGDEVNVIRPGANYGWPIITYGINYNGQPISNITEREGLEQPLHYWVPSIAASGLAFYTGDRFPNWRGSLFAGGLAGTVLARLEFDGHRFVSEERLLTDLGQRIRDVRDGPNGYLYIVTDGPQGRLLRLEPTD